MRNAQVRVLRFVFNTVNRLDRVRYVREIHECTIPRNKKSSISENPEEYTREN